MIKSLRKRHRQVWLVWAFLLPMGIFFSWLVIPDQMPVKLLQSERQELLPVVVSTANKDEYQVSIRRNSEGSQWQLQWQAKAILTNPSAVIYQIVDTMNDITWQQLVGRIESGKDHLFLLPDDSMSYKKVQFVLYDFIHEQIIDSINF